MAVRLIVGDADLTEKANNLRWTNADTGGHETCEFEIPNDCACPQPGDTVTVWEGLQRVWMGRVEEPGDNYDERRAPGQVGAVGAGAALKDNDVSMVFMDRSMARWQPISRQREVNLVGTSWGPQAHGVQPDGTTGAPALATRFQGAWTASGRAICEAWYDAGQNNLIGRIRAGWTRGANVSSGADANFNWDAFLSSDDILTTTDTTGDRQAAGPGIIDLTTAGNRRYAALRLLYNAGPAGADNLVYVIYWTNLRVIGDHGLTIRGATAAEEGFYPEDIAAWVVDQVDGIDRGTFDASNFILLHSAYYTPVPHHQIIDEMAGLLGWHWGVWAPDSVVDDIPVLHFREPPEQPTATVSRSDCRQLRLAQRLSDFHNQCRVSYTDAAGTAASVLVTRANPRLPAGLTRTLQLDMGLGDAAAATALGEYALALEEQQTRAAGSTELPAEVISTTRGRIPAHLLRPGLDRLKIVGLPRAGLWTDSDTRRFDTFRIRRTSSRVVAGGAVVTMAEVDSGANLLEVLQARLAIAAGLAN